MKFFYLRLFIIALLFHYNSVFSIENYQSPPSENGTKITNTIPTPLKRSSYSLRERIASSSRGGNIRSSNNRVASSNSYDVSDLPRYTEEDLYWMSRVIYAEAPKDTTEGQIAVANVVLNRLNAGWSDSVKNVIFQQVHGVYQFTPVEDGKIYTPPSDRAIQNAKRALLGERVIPNDIYFFYMPAPYNQNDWIRSRKVYKKIGIHLFCY